MPKRLAKGKHLLFLKLQPGAISLVEQPSQQGQGPPVYVAPAIDKVYILRACFFFLFGCFFAVACVCAI